VALPPLYQSHAASTILSRDFPFPFIAAVGSIITFVIAGAIATQQIIMGAIIRF